MLERWRRPRTLSRLLSSKAGATGLLAVVVLSALAVLTPVIAPYDPLAQGSLPFVEPSPEHLLGTDELGRDVASRILYGLRLSLFSAVVAAAAAAVTGIAIGVFSGFFGGWIDGLLMRVMDVVLSVPTILLALVLVAMLGGGLVPLIVAIAVVGVPPFARLTRASVLSVRSGSSCWPNAQPARRQGYLMADDPAERARSGGCAARSDSLNRYIDGMRVELSWARRSPTVSFAGLDAGSGQRESLLGAAVPGHRGGRYRDPRGVLRRFRRRLATGFR